MFFLHKSKKFSVDKGNGYFVQLVILSIKIDQHKLNLKNLRINYK